MSEWKYCLGCDHHFKQHVSLSQECLVDGCACDGGEFDLADLF